MTNISGGAFGETVDYNETRRLYKVSVIDVICKDYRFLNYS